MGTLFMERRLVRRFSFVDSRITRTAYSTWCWWRCLLDVIPRCFKVWKYFYSIYISILSNWITHLWFKSSQIDNNFSYVHIYLISIIVLQDHINLSNIFSTFIDIGVIMTALFFVLIKTKLSSFLSLLSLYTVL